MKPRPIPSRPPMLAPLAIFDVSGEIFAEMFAFLVIDFGFFTFEKEFPIFGPETLLSFEIDFFRPPILASELDDGDLLIHTGDFAEQRLLGNATDLSEHIVINIAGAAVKDNRDDLKVLRNYWEVAVKPRATKELGLWKKYYAARRYLK